MNDANLAETDEYSLVDEIRTLNDRRGEAAALECVPGRTDDDATDGHRIIRGLLLCSRARRILFADGLTCITTDKALRARECIEELGPENIPESLLTDFLELIYVGHRLGYDQNGVLNLYAELLLIFAGRLEDVIDIELGSSCRTVDAER
jgi:hypothetical protein